MQVPSSTVKQKPFMQLQQRQIVVDTAHQGQRSVGCAVFAASTLILLLILSQALQANILFLLLPAVLGASLVTAVVAFALRSQWRSRRFLEFDENMIALVDDGNVEHQVDPGRTLSLLAWCFVVRRNTRVPRGWRVVALMLEQGDDAVVVYTLFEPDGFATWKRSPDFVELQPTDEKRGRESAKRKLAGRQRRLFDAEERRHLYGAEVGSDTFIEVYEQILQLDLTRGVDRLMDNVSDAPADAGTADGEPAGITDDDRAGDDSDDLIARMG